MGSSSLVGTGFQSGTEDENVLETGGGDGCTSM